MPTNKIRTRPSTRSSTAAPCHAASSAGVNLTRGRASQGWLSGPGTTGSSTSDDPIDVGCLRASRLLHRTVVDRTRWFVGADDDAQIGNRHVDRSHGRRQEAIVEQATTRPEQQRKCHEPEAVDEVVLHQSVEEVAASPDLQLVAGFVLERLYRGDDVAGHEVSGIRVLAAPRRIGPGERLGNDVLR